MREEVKLERSEGWTGGRMREGRLVKRESWRGDVEVGKDGGKGMLVGTKIWMREEGRLDVRGEVWKGGLV